MTQKIVYNTCYGGFGLSDEAITLYNKKAGITISWRQGMELERDDPILVAVVEELGSEKASGEFAKLQIREIDDGLRWEIENFGGVEGVVGPRVW